MYEIQWYLLEWIRCFRKMCLHIAHGALRNTDQRGKSVVRHVHSNIGEIYAVMACVAQQLYVNGTLLSSKYTQNELGWCFSSMRAAINLIRMGSERPLAGQIDRHSIRPGFGH